MRRKTILALVAALTIISVVGVAPAMAAKPAWDGTVLAPLKTAQPYDWSAPDGVFTGHECGNVKYKYDASSFNGVLELKGFKQAGPYVLTVDTADDGTLAGLGCDFWTPWTAGFGETFVGGTNGCWDGNPYADVKLFNLEQYDSNHDGFITDADYYGGTIPFDVPLPDGDYNLKFFIKLDWHQTSASGNIMMMNDMNGDPRYGKVTQPTKKEINERCGFSYDADLKVNGGVLSAEIVAALPSYDAISPYDAVEKLILQTTAWCCPSCQPPASDPNYMDTIGVVFYKTESDTFEGMVVLTDTVPQLLQIKLEGMGSLSADAESNEWIGYIGRWWDNTTSSNINDTQYESVKGTNDVLGYVVFDGFDTGVTSQSFALDYSYHTLWGAERGDVSMTPGDYRVNFALTENTWAYRGIFVSENPLEFTIE